MLHRRVGRRGRGGWTCRCDRPRRAPGSTTGPRCAGRRGRVVGRRWRPTSTVDAFERHVADLARRLDGDGPPPRNGCGAALRCAAGPTGRPGCATPTSPSTRKPTPCSAPTSTPPSPPNGPSRTAAARSTSCAPTPSSHSSRRGRCGATPAQVDVLIDHATLLHGLHERSVCETSDGQPLTPDAVRRLACDAELIPTVLGVRRGGVGPGTELAGWPAPSNATRCERCTARVATPAARCASLIVRSITSSDRSTDTDHRPRQPLPALQRAPPPRPRRRLAPHPAPRPHDQPATPRRHRRLPRLQHRRRPHRHRSHTRHPTPDTGSPTR